MPILSSPGKLSSVHAHTYTHTQNPPIEREAASSLFAAIMAGFRWKICRVCVSSILWEAAGSCFTLLQRKPWKQWGICMKGLLLKAPGKVNIFKIYFLGEKAEQQLCFKKGKIHWEMPSLRGEGESGCFHVAVPPQIQISLHVTGLLCSISGRSSFCEILSSIRGPVFWEVFAFCEPCGIFWANPYWEWK